MSGQLYGKRGGHVRAFFNVLSQEMQQVDFSSGPEAAPNLP
jgi:hypothetical protein